jgi:hypothetical protein
MKHFTRWVMIMALFSAATMAGWPQQQQQEQRPTLRRGHGSLGGPNTSSTINRRALLRVHSIFIEPMENRLGYKLAGDMAKLSGIRLAEDKSSADAVLSGTCLDSSRLKLLHSEVFLSDRVTGAAIWQDVVRLPLYPPPLPKALDQTAERITRDLAESFRQAESR